VIREIPQFSVPKLKWKHCAHTIGRHGSPDKQAHPVNFTTAHFIAKMS